MGFAPPHFAPRATCGIIDATMDFNPPKVRGLLWAVGFATPLLMILFAGIVMAVTEPATGLNVAGVALVLAVLPPLGWLSYRAVGLAGARYRVAADALEVIWGSRREVIPLRDIEEAHPAALFTGELTVRGLNWPGCVVSRFNHSQLGLVEVLAVSAEKRDLLLIGYPGGWLALSPRDANGFLQALSGRRLAAPRAGASLVPARVGLSLLRDRVAIGLLAAAAVTLGALIIYLLLIWPQLPPVLALRFNADGTPERFGAPVGLFILPAIGAVAFVLNSLYGAILHSRAPDRQAAYVILSASIAIQALVWVATFYVLFAGAS